MRASPLLPVLYLRGVSTGRYFQEALGALLARTRSGLPVNRVQASLPAQPPAEQSSRFASQVRRNLLSSAGKDIRHCHTEDGWRRHRIAHLRNSSTFGARRTWEALRGPPAAPHPLSVWACGRSTLRKPRGCEMLGWLVPFRVQAW
jgi:hypothetical protein